MVIKKSAGEYVFDAFNYLFLTVLTLLTLYPLLYVLFASLSDGTALMQNPGVLLRPAGFSLAAYRNVLSNPNIVSGYVNTIYIVVVGTTINIVMTSMGAYVLARKDFYWKNFITGIIIFTMFFGGGLIPTFLLIRDLGMMHTHWALIIPGAISVFNMIIMRTTFQTIPESLVESARIDGANEFTILFKLIIPLSLPTIAVMILRYGVGHWNSWFDALIYLGDRRSLWPLQLFLREVLIQNQNQTDQMDVDFIAETVRYATIVVATVPILLAYPFLQKYFVKGIMIGSLKG